MTSITVSTPAAKVAASAGRILLSLIFVSSGFGKLAAPAATKAYMAAMGMPLVDLFYVGAVAIELGLGLALMFGYRTRLAAALLAAFALVTGFIFHHNFADQNQMIHFMKNLAIAGGMLQVAAFGADTFSFDALRGKRLANA
jgi:putative oxidoreductase